MLVVPPATAYLLTDRLHHMVLLSVLIGVAASTLGYGMARLVGRLDRRGDGAGHGACCSCWRWPAAPRHGLVARAVERWRLGRTLREQFLLLHLEHDGPTALAGPAPPLLLDGAAFRSRRRPPGHAAG